MRKLLLSLMLVGLIALSMPLVAHATNSFTTQFIATLSGPGSGPGANCSARFLAGPLVNDDTVGIVGWEMKGNVCVPTNEEFDMLEVFIGDVSMGLFPGVDLGPNGLLFMSAAGLCDDVAGGSIVSVGLVKDGTSGPKVASGVVKKLPGRRP